MTEVETATSEWRRSWVLPIAAALGYATSVLHIYSIGAFVGPLQREFGWSRAETTAGITIAAVITALGCIPVGVLVDRIGPRRIGLIGVLLMCGAFALGGTATGTLGNWLAIWVCMAIGTFFVQATVWTSAVASRFERSRGLAFAVTLSGASIAVTIFPLLATWLIGAYDWRTAYVALGLLWAGFVFPILALFFRSARDTKQAGKRPIDYQGVRFSEGLRSTVLYKLLCAAGFFSFTIIGIVVHFVPILVDGGSTPMSAAGIASLIGIFSIIGRLTTGVLLDKFPAHLVGTGAFLIPIVACALLLIDASRVSNQVVAAAIVGLTLGSEVDVIAYLAAKYFGLKSFGGLYGVLQMVLNLGTAFGPLAAGAVFDRYTSYAPFLTLTMVLMLVAAIALFSLRAAGDSTRAASKTSGAVLD